MTVSVVGTSISQGGWLPDVEHTGIWPVVNTRLKDLGYRPVVNRGRGGLAIRNPATGEKPALEYVKQVVQQDCPTAVVLELGANDWSTHTPWSSGTLPTDLGYCAFAADEIDQWLHSQGIATIWCTGMPVANSFRCVTHQPQGMRNLTGGRLYLIGSGTGINSLEPMNAKVCQWNDWLWAAGDAGTRTVVDIWSPLQPDNECNGNPALYLDGLHPNAAGSALIAHAFDVGALIPHLEAL